MLFKIQLRVDFNTFVIAGPNTLTATVGTVLYGQPTVAGGTGVDVTQETQCSTDQFTMTGPAGTVPPVICGTNSGYHGQSGWQFFLHFNFIISHGCVGNIFSSGSLKCTAYRLSRSHPVSFCLPCCPILSQFVLLIFLSCSVLCPLLAHHVQIRFNYCPNLFRLVSLIAQSCFVSIIAPSCPVLSC